MDITQQASTPRSAFTSPNRSPELADGLSLSKGVWLGSWRVAETRSSFDKLRMNGFL